MPVKVFSVPVEALEMVYEVEEFVVGEAHPQELQVPLALDCHPLQGVVWDIHGHDLRLVFKGPVLGPQKDQGPDWTGLIWDRTAVLVLP